MTSNPLPPGAKNPTLKRAILGDMMQTVGILPILILIVAVFGFVAPNFFTDANLLNIARQASINIVLAAGMTFIILTGGIDLSVGSMLGTTAVVAMAVSLMPGMAGLSIPLALLAGLGDGAVQWISGGLRRFAAVYRYAGYLYRPAWRGLFAGGRHHHHQLEYQF
ncbi:Ribose transport system permease protein rbsC [Serratia plymuthica]|uniref:Ribose transport system permease protein rbsC n=1 Tax=Serratia plymuthica TaxID=82996 RepID=A0A2X4U0I0_SERPL|nr:Ribose transport system permease protein rbsC [Serratia plymuthica]